MKSLTIDTNILIRHLVDNDPKFSQLLSQKHTLLIPPPIFFETIFVLQKYYQVPRSEIVKHLLAIASDKQVDTDKNLISASLDIYLHHPKLSIIDSYLIAFSHQTGSHLETYDQALQKAFTNLQTKTN